MNYDTYKSFLRVVTVGISVLLWFISVHFSRTGFAINVPAQAWMGWALALAITVIEMVLRSEGRNHNPTILLVGLAAYAYGIWTNVEGIMGWQGLSIDAVRDNFLRVGFPLILGFFLEITPEPLLIWALIGLSDEDFLGKIVTPNRQHGVRRPKQKPIPIQQPGFVGTQTFSPDNRSQQKSVTPFNGVYLNRK